MKPLTSWKEIGAYLGRTARTAQRWEQAFGLPVRRMKKGSSSIVWALPVDIDEWLRRDSVAGRPEDCSPELTLQDFVEALAHGVSLRNSLEALAHALERGRDCLVALLCATQGRRHFVPLAAPSLPVEFHAACKQFPLSGALGSADPALLTNQVVICEDIHQDPKWKSVLSLAKRFRFGASVSLPIPSPAGRALGSLWVYYPRPCRPSEEDIRRFTAAADLAGFILARAARPI